MVITRLLEELDPFSEDVVRRLRAQTPSYEAVPFAEHLGFVRGQMRDILEGVAAGSRPTVEAIASSEELGWRRASQGVPVEDVMEAYHFCYREMWLALVGLARESPAGSGELVGLVDILWSWTHGLSAVVAKAHAAALRTSFAQATDMRRRLFDALRAGDTQSQVSERLAASLGFDPHGVFQALAAPDSAVLDHHAGAGTVHAWSSDGFATVLMQDVDARALAATMAGNGERTPIGIGLARPGLAGAVATMRDAWQALDLAERRGGTLAFEEAWLFALVHADREALEPLLRDGARTARDHPRLAETVVAFAAHRFRVTGCAHSLHLHPNSAKYRLDRWAALTGWDPQTLDGLVRSLAAIHLWGDAEARPSVR